MKDGKRAQQDQLQQLLRKHADEIKSRQDTGALERRFLPFAGRFAEFVRCTGQHYECVDYHCELGSSWQLKKKGDGAETFDIDMWFCGETSGEGTYGMAVSQYDDIGEFSDSDPIVDAIPDECITDIAAEFDCAAEDVQKFFRALLEYRSGAWPNFKQ